MTRTLAIALLCAAAPAPWAASAAEADAFAGKVPPIAGQLYRKAGRLEVTPAVELSVNDAFFSKVLLGGKATYHVRDWLAVTGAFSTGFSSATGSTQICSPPPLGCHAASEAELQQVPGEIKSKGSLEGGFSPFYGKLNLLAEKVAHFDLSVLAGGDVITYREVLPPPDPANPASPATKTSFGFHAGLGSRLFLGEWGALRLEFKDYFYGVRLPVRGEPTRRTTKWEQQLSLEMGISFFIPFRNRSP